MKRSRFVPACISVALLILLFGCTNPVSPPSITTGDVESRKLLSKVTDGAGNVHETGVLGPGALYEIRVPAGWAQGQRGLVMYVHGYVTPGSPIALPSDLDAVFGSLMAQGFAVADSSFSENGWAVKDGAIRTRQLRGYFTGAYGTPAKVYLVGVSEGGIISLMLAEQNPDLFDGALTVCGVVGGADEEMRYILNERVLFDYFFRVRLKALAFAGDPIAIQLDSALGKDAFAASPAGTSLPSDGAPFVAAVAQTVGTLLAANPTGTIALATMTVDGKPLYNWPPQMLQDGSFGTELLITVATGLWFNIFGTADLLGRTHEDIPIDTTAALYYSPVLNAVPGANDALNLGVERLTSRPDASNYLSHWYVPKGTLRIPLVTLHTTRDPVVPVFHEYALQKIEGTRGSAFLAQFAADGFGHVQVLEPPSYATADPAFTQQMMGAFAYLDAWVTTGHKPTSAQAFGLTPLP